MTWRKSGVRVPYRPPTKPRIENRFGVFVLLKFFHYYKKHLFIDTEIIEVKIKLCLSHNKDNSPSGSADDSACHRQAHATVPTISTTHCQLSRQHALSSLFICSLNMLGVRLGYYSLYPKLYLFIFFFLHFHFSCLTCQCYLYIIIVNLI